MKFELEGIFPAMLTPFTKNGARVDYDKACALATRLAKKGVHGLFVAGTTGEGPLMTVPERKELLEEVVGAVGKRIRVLAHTGAFDTDTAIELTQHAAEVGAAAAGVVTPGFYTYDDASLKQHFKAVARSVKGFPVMLYNIPGCAKNLLSLPVILELAKIDNVVGLKDSTGVMQDQSLLRSEAPPDFVIINGCDEFSYQAYLSGMNGTVSSTANVVPELFLSIYKNVKKGNLKKAWSEQVKLGKACKLFQYGRMVAYYKEGLRMRGFDPGFVRPPQRELTAEELKAFRRNFKATGLK